MKLCGWLLLAGGTLLCGGVLLLCLWSEPDGIPAASGDERTLYLFSQGWKAREETRQEITVPDCEDAVFAAYAALQARQGMPLKHYEGKRAVRYLYRLEQSELYAELMTADGILIGAACLDPGSHTLLDIAGKPFT